MLYMWFSFRGLRAIRSPNHVRGVGVGTRRSESQKAWIKLIIRARCFIVSSGSLTQQGRSVRIGRDGWLVKAAGECAEVLKDVLQSRASRSRCGEALCQVVD